MSSGLGLPVGDDPLQLAAAPALRLSGGLRVEYVASTCHAGIDVAAARAASVSTACIAGDAAISPSAAIRGAGSASSLARATRRAEGPYDQG